jgi:hypothetical protein
VIVVTSIGRQIVVVQGYFTTYKVFTKLVFFNVVSRKKVRHPFSPHGRIFCHVTKNIATCVPYNLFGIWVLDCITCVDDIMITFNYKKIIELKN